jgi:inward rectifier potassium channel
MATIPPSPPAPPAPASVRWNRIASINNVVRVGLERSYFDDLYHFLLVARWSHLLGIIAALYVGVNALFAGLYLLGGDVIAGAEPGSFGDAFFFSVQTLSTIGYGVMSPKGLYGCVLVTCEAFVGLLGIAMASGLMFSKFARPTSRVLFTRQLLIANRDGKPHLMFRIANQRGNDVVEASIRITVGKEETTAEGDRLRRLHDLKLIRNQQPLFVLTWTVMHPIDDSSPLYGESEESLINSNTNFIITFTGLDGTFASTVHARYIYSAEDLVWGGHFVDVTSVLPDGRLRVDYQHFHEIEPLRPDEAKPSTRPDRRHEASYDTPLRKWSDAAPPPLDAAPPPLGSAASSAPDQLTPG